MNPVTRPGPSCGTAHSFGCGTGSLHAMSRTVGSPGTPYFASSRAISSVSSVASIFSGTNRSAISALTAGSVKTCKSSSLHAAHHSAEKSTRSPLPLARAWATADGSSRSHGISGTCGLAIHPIRRTTATTSTPRVAALSACSRRCAWKERLNAPKITAAKASDAETMPTARGPARN